MASAAQQPANRETNLDDLDQLLRSNQQIVVMAPGCTGVELPESVIEILRQAVGYMLQGKAVTLTPVHRNLTTQEAADLLGVSRPFLVELLGKKEIPFHLVGTHRRIYLEDLLRFRERRDKGRKEIINQMAREAMENGDYDQVYTTDDDE
jgi:excisionase family DNA binding protein